MQIERILPSAAGLGDTGTRALGHKHCGKFLANGRVNAHHVDQVLRNAKMKKGT